VWEEEIDLLEAAHEVAVLHVEEVLQEVAVHPQEVEVAVDPLEVVLVDHQEVEVDPQEEDLPLLLLEEVVLPQEEARQLVEVPLEVDLLQEEHPLVAVVELLLLPPLLLFLNARLYIPMIP